MLSPPPTPGIPGYNDYRAPTEADVRAALQRVFGPERGTEHWTQACRAAGLAAGRVDGAEPLTRAVQALSSQGGPCVAVARSIEIRMRTYTRLASRSPALSDGGQG
jgi:crotonobetainyl-CoA:carnitine CoA-transferase CaiB-like acyl-CoA transferase